MKVGQVCSSFFVVALFTASLTVTTVQAYSFGPTEPGKWGNPTFGAGATVTWSLMPTGTSIDEGNGTISNTFLGDFLPTGWESVVVSAFTAWSNVANLTFMQVSDDDAAFNANTLSGDIRLGSHIFDGQSGILAHGYYPPNNGNSAAGDIHLDSAENWTLNGGGIDLFTVLAHEIGHALGLGHSADVSAMMYPYYSHPNTLHQDDIDGIQFLYGAKTSSVPEPATFILFGLGSCGLGFMRRFQQRGKPR